jgi:hypothetical protein
MGYTARTDIESAEARTRCTREIRVNIVPKETGRTGVMRAVIDLLTIEKIWHMRVNVGAFHNGKRPVFFGRKGMADLLALLPVITANTADELITVHRVVWLEIKRPGEHITAEQQAFREEVEAEGHLYLIIEDAAELQAWLKGNK